MEIFTSAILLFFVLSIINVFLQTIKTIATVKSSTAHAVIMNMVTYGFYTVIIKQISTFNILIGIVVIVLSNMIGVYIARKLLEKFKKDKIWKIECYFTYEDNIQYFISRLEEYGNFSYFQNGIMLTLFSYSQKESQIIKKHLQNLPVKHIVLEVERSL